MMQTLGGDKDIVADRDFPAVHEFAVDIQKKIVAYCGVVSVCTKKRLFHNAVIARFPQQFTYGVPACIALERMQIVVVVQFFYSDVAVCRKLGIAGLIKHAGM